MSNEDLKALKCEACGGDIVKSYRIVDEDEEVPIAKCLSCGAEHDQYSQEYYEFFADDFNADKDDSIFELGLKGTLDGKEYEIIGRIRLQEEDEEEPEAWNEWLAVSSDGGYHFFVEEEGEVHSYEEYTPESIDLESSDSYIDFEGKNVSKDDGYIARIVFFEGELTWKPEIGEPVKCYDFKKDGFKYSIEQSEGEVSISRGTRVTYGEIIDAFGGDEHKDLYDQTIAKRKEYKKKSMIYLVGMALSFAAIMFSCNSGEKVEGLKNWQKDKKVISFNVPQKNRTYMSQVIYGPFEIPKGKSLYEMKLSVNERIQSLDREWQSFRLMLLTFDNFVKFTSNQPDFKKLFLDIDGTTEPVESFSIVGDFWDEVGYDSDGRWHENDLEASTDFVLDESGKYVIYLELYSNKRRSVNAVNVTLEKTGSVRYYVIVFFIMLIMFFVNKSKSTSFNLLPFEMASE